MAEEKENKDEEDEEKERMLKQIVTIKNLCYRH